jgi:hypothetical protein
VTDLEEGGSGPGAKQCRWSQKAGKEEETDAPLGPPQSSALAIPHF